MIQEHRDFFCLYRTVRDKPWDENVKNEPCENEFQCKSPVMIYRWLLAPYHCEPQKTWWIFSQKPTHMGRTRRRIMGSNVDVCPWTETWPARLFKGRMNEREEEIYFACAGRRRHIVLDVLYLLDATTAVVRRTFLCLNNAPPDKLIGAGLFQVHTCSLLIPQLSCP
jgi:hypothetical protein